MGIEDILVQADAEVENEYEDEFDVDEGEGGTSEKGGISMSLKKAARIVDKENEFDARESLQLASRMQQEPEVASRSPRRDIDHEHHDYDDTVDHGESIEDKMRKADAKVSILPNAEEKTKETVEDAESVYDSDEDETDYEDSKDFLFCCYRRRIDEVCRHLERGATLRATDRHGWTPLHWVCAKGYDDVLEVLLKECRGNNVKKYINQKDDLMGFTPLHWACVGGHVECIKILFDKYNAKRLKNNIGELPIDVLNVNISSPLGRQIAKIFRIQVEDNDCKQPQEEKRSFGGRSKSSRK